MTKTNPGSEANVSIFESEMALVAAASLTWTLFLRTRAFATHVPVLPYAPRWSTPSRYLRYMKRWCCSSFLIMRRRSTCVLTLRFVIPCNEATLHICHPSSSNHMSQLQFIARASNKVCRQLANRHQTHHQPCPINTQPAFTPPLPKQLLTRNPHLPSHCYA